MDPDYRAVEVIKMRVAGVPVTQGSKVAGVNPHTGRAFVREQGGDRLKGWRIAVNSEAQRAYEGRTPWQGPVMLEVRFAVPKPASAPKRRRTYPIKARSGDVDKLARAVLDALTGVAFTDDSQVIVLIVHKDFADNGWTGVDVGVHHLE